MQSTRERRGFELIPDSKKHRFYVRGIGDRLLTLQGSITYMLFFDVDEAFRGIPVGWNCEIFPTKNGFHAVGLDLVNLEQKIAWYNAWKQLYPKSDYPLHSFSWLHPHSNKETLFICKVAMKAIPLDMLPTCEYYRDKEVFEPFLKSRKTKQ